jgi:hypothetical protein
MKTLFVLLVALMIHSSPAFAQSDAAPVPSLDSVILLGKGYFDSHDRHRSIAFACKILNEDQSCKVASFVYFENQVARYIGPELTISDPEQIKKEMGSWFPSLEARREKARANRRTALVAGAIGSAITLGSGVVWLPVLGGGYAIVLYALTGVNNPDALILATPVSAGNVAKVIRDQDGWNWSSRPKKLNHQVFESMISDLSARQAH